MFLLWTFKKKKNYKIEKYLYFLLIFLKKKKKKPNLSENIKLHT